MKTQKMKLHRLTPIVSSPPSSAELKSAEAQQDAGRRRISVIIPIYNEAKSLKELVARLKNVFQKEKKPYELIFVDDNSTDETDTFFKTNKEENIIFLKKDGKEGKAYSLIQGFEKATGDIICMIDGDLQYPPEVIPQMVEALKNADVVVANRKEYKDSLSRKVVSSVFRFAFGKVMFGLGNDIQSGLKVFTREVAKTVKFKPGSAWSFDLEFLYRAKQAGFIICNFDIVFSRRKNGNSKIGFVKTTFEIGTNALRLRAKRIQPVHFPSNKKESMLGAGVGFKKRKYITHTSMHHSLTAIKTFTLTQKIVFGMVLMDVILGFYLHPLLTLQIIVAVLSLIYFIDVVFNLHLIIKSLRFPQEISSSDEDLSKIDEKKLPVYTILCPLYREAHVLPQFLSSIEKISWPKDKLDVILLLEEDDKNTLEAVDKMSLPSYVRALVVPHSIPKTKPKACNYGLCHAKGEYLVIYDAEDIPDPLQLKKAYLGFKKVGPRVICLQAKLNYYNPHQNLLTRFFTAEYSLWFDVTLTGLQSIDTAIPLGGTSNHFKTKNLIDIEGWDPFNVTEDADLGMRLFKKGFRTAIIDSVTLEEANSRLGNWVRQRSRWIKGYMQTYLVHIREASNHGRKQGIHSLIFQLVIGGKIAFILINPLLWIATFSYFAFYAYVGPQIEALYPSVVFYMALTSLVFGNFLFLYYYMIGVAKKGQWSLMKYVFLIPIYWVMISIAAVVALYQLIFKPHYWEKTIHGFHLEKNDQKKVAISIVKGEEAALGFAFPAYLRNKILSSLNQNKGYLGGALLIIGAMFGNFLNFVFNTYLGRTLDLKDFAAIGLISSFMYFASIPFAAIGTTVNHRAGFLIGKYGLNHAQAFISTLTKNILIVTLIASLLWLILTPVNINFFNNSDALLYLSFTVVLMIGFLNSVNYGYFSGKLLFGLLGLVAILEPSVKLAIAYGLTSLSLGKYTYLSIPLSFLFTFLIGFLLLKKEKIIKFSEKFELAKDFPKKFLGASVLTNLSGISFLSLDIILANHYLSPMEAGRYSLLSLTGKIIFFFGGLSIKFIIPLVSRNEGANKSSKGTFNKILLATTFLSLAGFIALGVFGTYTVPLLFGVKAQLIFDYLIFFSLAMMLFTVSRVFVSYYLAKKIYSFAVVPFLLSIVQLILIKNLHETVGAFVLVMLLIGCLNFALLSIMHVFSSYVKVVENNLLDLAYLFKRLPSVNKVKKDRIAILIFNWRDTRHKWAGGAEVYIHELAKRWVKDGNSVTLFCGNVGKLPKNEVIDGVQIYRRGGFCTVYVWAMLYYIFKFRGRYDVVIDSENGIPFFTPLYAKEKKFLLIHHVHQEVFRKSLRWPLSRIALVLEANLMPVVYRNIQVITVSPSSKEAILRHKLTKKEPIIIYNGVDLEMFKPGIKSKNPMVLYIGRLQHYKSLDIFIKAAKEVHGEVPNAEFVIAGVGEEKKKLQKYAKKIGILDKIQFLGYVSNEEKIKLMQQAWVFVNPSFMEGWGITTIEAAACGTPTVASNVPGLRDSIKNLHTGILVKYGDYEGFAMAIEAFIQDKTLRAEMSNEAINWAKNYSWEKSAAELYSIVNSHIKVKEERTTEKRRIFTGKFAYLVNKVMSILS